MARPTEDEIRRVGEYLCSERRFHLYKVVVEDETVPIGLLCSSCKREWKVVDKRRFPEPGAVPHLS